MKPVRALGRHSDIIEAEEVGEGGNNGTGTERKEKNPWKLKKIKVKKDDVVDEAEKVACLASLNNGTASSDCRLLVLDVKSSLYF